MHASCGLNLASASEPRYLDTPAGRVALIAATSTHDRTWAAGEQSTVMIGRPGVNPLRYKTTYVVSPDKFALLQSVAHVSGINVKYNNNVRNG